MCLKERYRAIGAYGCQMAILDELDSVEWIAADIKAVNYIKESLTF